MIYNNNPGNPKMNNDGNHELLNEVNGFMKGIHSNYALSFESEISKFPNLEKYYMRLNDDLVMHEDGIDENIGGRHESHRSLEFQMLENNLRSIEKVVHMSVSSDRKKMMVQELGSPHTVVISGPDREVVRNHIHNITDVIMVLVHLDMVVFVCFNGDIYVRINDSNTVKVERKCRMRHVFGKLGRL